MLNSSVGAIGEWLSVGGENGFPQELGGLLLRLLLWGNCPHFFPQRPTPAEEGRNSVFFFFLFPPP